MNFRKPGFWISLLGIAAIVFVALCLVTSPGEEEAVRLPETVETAMPVAAVTVRNPDELLAAIAPNTEILMEPGAYILSEADCYGREISEYCRWEERFDGYQLTLSGVENLTIRGSGSLATTLETDPRYANVIGLEHCSNIVLEDFTAGHTRDRGECGGGVIDLINCYGVTMNRMGLFGCGVVGINADGCDGLTVNDCDIYDCSSSAAGIYNSWDVVIYGCRIYNIGDERYGGYTYFDIQSSKGVFIENNHLSDSTTNSLLSVTRSEVLLKNNLFENNRPQDAAFVGTERSVTMDGNRFEGNNIRSWYSVVEVAKDPDGRALSEVNLNEMYGTKPEVSTQPQLEIHVSTVDEFIAAIGPNTEIVLDGAEYDLSTATGYGTSGSEYYYWEDIFDGPGLVITNVSNMTIRSNDGKLTEHILSAVPRYADVLQFVSCSGITVSGFTAGHTREAGSCTGGVLEFRDCDGITVDNCGLFGCGILGVQAENCSKVIVQNSTVYECSQGGIEMRNVDGIVIEGTSFRDIGGRNTIYLASCRNAMVDGEPVLMNESGLYQATTPEQEELFALERVVNDFANSYLYNDREYMQIYLAEGYEPEPWVTEFEYSSLFWMEISSAHVLQIRNSGSCVLEVPFMEWNGDWVDENDIRYLLVTVIEEEGLFRVSDCREK